MQTYQHEFLQFAIDQQVLRFGEFTLKSGRVSPYFFDAGLFNNGRALARLGRFYAQALIQSGVEFDMLFGPAYKGIPLATACAIAFADHHDRDLPWAFNRKEAKDHGEGGSVVGAPLAGRVLIVDDVITAGTAVRETMAILDAAGARPAGVVIALDRQERGREGGRSAVQEVERTCDIPVVSIVRLDHLVEFMRPEPGCTGLVERIEAYRAAYGVSAP